MRRLWKVRFVGKGIYTINVGNHPPLEMRDGWEKQDTEAYFLPYREHLDRLAREPNPRVRVEAFYENNERPPLPEMPPLDTEEVLTGVETLKQMQVAKEQEIKADKDERARQKATTAKRKRKSDHAVAGDVPYSDD